MSKNAVPLLLFLLLLPATGSQAAPPEPDAPPVDSPVAAPGWKAEDHYRYAVRCLTHGRTFARAVEHLREAVRREPENADYQLALACACTSRVASLAFASTVDRMFQQERDSYPKRYSEWETRKKQALEKGEEFTEKAPDTPPPAFPTRDDDKPVKLSPQEVATQLSSLQQEALTAFEEATKLAKTPEQRAEIEQSRGWGGLLLYFYGMVHQEGRRMANDPSAATAPTPQKVAKLSDTLLALEKSTELVPDRAVYWESLGFIREFLKSTAPGKSNMGMTLGKDEAGYKPPTEAQAWEAFDTALRLNKRNAPLWYKKAGYARQSTSAQAVSGASETERKCLEAASAADPSNALRHYEVSAALLRGNPFDSLALFQQRQRSLAEQTPGRTLTPRQMEMLAGFEKRAHSTEALSTAQEALRRLERGNAVPGVVPLRYQPPVPKLLVHAWSYFGDYYSANTENGQTQALELGRAACGYASVAAESGNVAEAQRTLRAVLTMAEKLMGDWPLQDRGRQTGEKNQFQTGKVVAQMAYSTLGQVYERAGNAQAAAQTAAEKHKLEVRLAQWQAAVDAAKRPYWAELF